jgi:16S rRNA processing protein RimM
MASSKRVCVGQFAGSNGVHGLVRLRSFMEVKEDIFRFTPVTDTHGVRVFEIAPAPQRGSGDTLLARVGGIDSREAAKAVGGLKLFIERERLPVPKNEDDFYYSDLIGLRVKLRDGRVLGVVTAIHETPPGDLVEVTVGAAVKGVGKTVLMPFTRAVVPKVDISGGVLLADPPPGLFETKAAAAAEVEQGSITKTPDEIHV